MIISCAPTPFIRSWKPLARRPRSPSIRNRGATFGTTRTDPPGLFADDPGLRMAKTSGGVEASLGLTEWTKCRLPAEPRKMKVRRLDDCGLRHDHPATGKDVLPHFGHLSLRPIESFNWLFRPSDGSALQDANVRSADARPGQAALPPPIAHEPTHCASCHRHRSGNAQTSRQEE